MPWPARPAGPRGPGGPAFPLGPRAPRCPCAPRCPRVSFIGLDEPMICDSVGCCCEALPPRRALSSGADRAHSRVLYRGRVERRAPASVVVLRQLRECPNAERLETSGCFSVDLAILFHARMFRKLLRKALAQKSRHRLICRRRSIGSLLRTQRGVGPTWNLA